MMKLSEPPRSFRDDDGHIRDELSIEDSAYDEIVLQRLGDDKLALRATTRDGETESYLLSQSSFQFVGLEYIEGDRRDIPDDLQDAIQLLGFMIQSDVVADYETL